jgi:hypothetical protein
MNGGKGMYEFRGAYPVNIHIRIYISNVARETTPMTAGEWKFTNLGAVFESVFDFFELRPFRFQFARQSPDSWPPRYPLPESSWPFLVPSRQAGVEGATSFLLLEGVADGRLQAV